MQKTLQRDPRNATDTRNLERDSRDAHQEKCACVCVCVCAFPRDILKCKRRYKETLEMQQTLEIFLASFAFVRTLICIARK